MFNANKVSGWLTQRQKAQVELVEEDSEVVEVVLKEGFINEPHQETIWVLGKFRYETGEMTLKQIKDDLKSWFSHVGSIESN